MKETFEQGKIYHLDYGGVEILGRLKEVEFMDYIFYDLLHYWNGYESFRYNNERCVKSGIKEIRRATQAEKMALIRFELEHNCI